MAAAAWLHGSTNMRLTEGLVSVLKEDRPEYLPALLANYREHGGVSAQNSAAVGGLIGLSNGRIGSSKTRFEGLCLLAVLVRDSSSDLFQQHCLSWLRSLQQVIQSQAPLPTVQLAVTILQDLLQYSSQLPELAREVGLNSVLGILTSLLGLKFECHLVAMEGMKACMIYYPRACGSLRDKLGAYFLSKMDSDDPKVQEVACECYGRLPCLGGVLERGGGARRAESWVNQLHCLLATAHSLLGQLYQGAESEGAVRYEGPGVELPFPLLDEADPLLQLQLRQRYRAVCLGLTRTLSVDPLSPVCLPMRSLLNLVCRGLAVSCKSVNVSGDGALRLLVLPSVHADTLDVLRALITAAGSRLVQFCSIVTRLLSQTLSAWSPQPETSPGQQRAYSVVRVSVYRTLELWVQVAGASAGVLQGSPTHTELLLVHLLTDITPGVESVKLRAGPSAASEHAGKAPPRRAKGVGDGGGVSLQKKGDALANQDTCVSALKALRQIVLSSGTLLKEDVHKRLQDLVVPLCVRLQQQQCGNDVGGASGQYGSALPRRELYRVLLALVLAPPARCPPPLPCAVSIFSHGRRDHSLKVSCFCTEALAICNALLHPRVPSIALPLPPLAVKPTPAAPTLAPSQNPSLSLPTLLGGPTAASPFPARHPISLGPTALMAPLENHLPLAPPVLPAATGPTPSDLLLSPHQPGELPPLGTAEGRRPVFVRYDKEEADDVEISLESDSDDSVVIVPPGMLILEAHDSAGPQPVPPPPAGSAGSDSGAVNSPLPNDLPSTVALSSNSNVVTTFPSQSQTQLVSLVPPINSSVAQLGTPSIGLGDSLPGTQLQQMLLQSPAAQPSQMGLPIQIQLQTQLAQSSRQLQQAQQQPMASEEDLTVININSSDEDEDEEEEMDEDDIGEEEDEEEEEPLDDEEEEEEVSDFPEDYYDGEEFADYEEEEEELIEGEEEESILEGDEEDGNEVPPLEEESARALVEREEGEALLGPVVEGVVGAFCTEEGEEQEGLSRGVQGQAAAYRPDGVQEEVKQTEVEELEATEPGVHESKRAEVEKSSAVCQDVHSDGQHHSSTEEASQEDELAEEAGADGGQEVSTHEQEVAPKGDLPTVGEIAVTLQERIPESSQEAREPDEKAGTAGTQEPPDAERRQEAKEEAAACPGERATSPMQDEGPEREEDEENGDNVKGRKRKREEGAVGEVEQSTEKKKVNEDSMASMLADFVECPPDEEENTHPVTQC